MTKRSRRDLRALVLAALGVLAATATSASPAAEPAATEPPATPAAGSFSGTAEVSVVEVPVQVVRDGQPVRGLAAADFTVFSGKQRQPLLGFEVIDVGLVDATNAVAISPIDVPVAGRRHFLFLFDLSTSDPHALGRAQDAALEVVHTALNPVDVAAVATYSPARGARVLLAFTSDRAQLELALSTLGSSELVEHRSDWLGLALGFAKDKVKMAERTLPGSGGDGPAAEARSAANQGRQMAQQELVRQIADAKEQEERGQNANEEQRAQNFTRSLRDLAELMQRLDGRKYVILLSEGFDSRVLLGDQRRAQRNLQTSDDDMNAILRTESERSFGSSKLQASFRRAIEEMRRADCLVHAIDIGRISSGGRDVAGELNEAATGEPQAPLPTRRGEETLFTLANGTGGALYRNFNDVGSAMRKVLDVSSVTYLLTIPAPKGSPGEGFVPLRVEVRGAKASEVSARAGFYATPTPLQQAATAERLRIGAEVLEGRAGGAVRAAALGVPLPGGGGACAVIEVDGRSLLEGHVGDMASADVTVYAFDRAGTIHAVARQLVGLDLNVVGEKLRGAGFKLFAGLDLPAGEYQLRALVRNTISGRYGIAVAPLVVLPGAGARTTLAGAFVEPTAGGWLLVRETSSGRPLSYPFTLGERVLVPAAAPHLRGGDSVTVWVEAPAGTAALEGLVKRADGAVAASAPLQLGERAPDATAAAERLLATFSPANLPPGGYTLEVRVPGSGAVASGLPFVVE
jgi:VWFA-related protein